LFGKTREGQRILYNYHGRRTGPKGKEDSVMALTRKFLKALGIEDEKIDQIIEEHTAVADRMNGEIEKYKADAAKLPAIQKEMEAARADLEAAKKDGWKDKHDALKKEFEDYKAGVTAKETKAAKESAARAYYQSKGITGKALEIAMRGSGAEVEALELGEDGKIKDTKALDGLVSGDFAGLVSTTTTKGADTPNPPANTGGGRSKEDIMKIKDAGERQKAMIENHELFGF